MLAEALSARPHFQYRPPSPDIMAKTTWLRTTCERFGIPIAALALQFSTRDPRIASTLVGVSSPERVQELVRHELLDIPEDLWATVHDFVGEGSARIDRRPAMPDPPRRAAVAIKSLSPTTSGQTDRI